MCTQEEGRNLRRVYHKYRIFRKRVDIDNDLRYLEKLRYTRNVSIDVVNGVMYAKINKW